MLSVKIIKQSDLSVYLMEVDDNQSNEYLNSLTSVEKEKLSTIHHPDKRLEYLASRHLRTLIFGKQQIHYSEVGSPYIENQGFISLSHTHLLVALAHSPVFNVGLDVERVREKAVKLHTKFIHPSEYEFFDVTSAADMSLLWSFKETLFKLADRKGVHFASDLIICKDANGFSGTIRQEGHLQEYRLLHEVFGNYLITCNGSAPINHTHEHP